MLAVGFSVFPGWGKTQTHPQNLTFLPREVRVSDLWFSSSGGALRYQQGKISPLKRYVRGSSALGRAIPGSSVSLCSMRGRWPRAFLSTVRPLQTMPHEKAPLFALHLRS